MVSVSEMFKTWQEGFTNKDSSKLEKFFTDDFEMVGASGNRSRQQTLEWVAAGGSPTSIGNLEVLFENDDNATVVHDADTVAATTGEFGKGQAMVFYAKRGDKISQCRVVRTPV
jgi:hypothetical protein